MTTRVALYERVSTQGQAEQGYSLPGQERDLRARMEAEGREVVEVISDPGEKRWMLDRPGIGRLKELADAGEIDEVWAWSWDRYGESPWPELLTLQLKERGVALRALDDGGEGEDAELVRAVKGHLASREQAQRVRRTSMGRIEKARAGHVMGQGRGPRYGFRAVRNDAGRVYRYELDEPAMSVVQRIFEMLADGESLYAVEKALETDGIPAPRGGSRWKAVTIKHMVTQDCYLVHTPDELAALVESGQLSREAYDALDPNRAYGIDWWGKRSVTRISHRTKKRRVEWKPKSQWIAAPVDLTGSGLARETVLRARANIEGNRASARVADREYELARGFLYCADCGRAMRAWAARAPGKKTRHYYLCRARHKPVGDNPAECSNNRSIRVEVLEDEAADLFESTASYGALVEAYEKAVAERLRGRSRRDATERRAALAARVTELETERKGHLRQNARGVLSDGELDAMLSEVDGDRDKLARELEAVGAEERQARALEATGAYLRNYVSAEWYEDPDAVHPGYFLTVAATPEEVRKVYRRYGARFEVDSQRRLILKLDLDLPAGVEGLHSTSTPRSTGGSNRRGCSGL